MSKKIFIIDDDETFRKTIKAALNLLHYNVVEASNGLEALEIAKKEKPDLIILDLLMPKVGGMKFLKTIQDDEELKRIPILVSTNIDNSERMSESVEYGVRGYIIKSNESLKTTTEAIKSIIGKAE